MAARAANGWQRAGARFDFEVFALPGGSILAPALWVYSMMLSMLRYLQSHSTEQQPAPDAPAAERAHCPAGARCT
jgi:hypothetical protein